MHFLRSGLCTLVIRSLAQGVRPEFRYSQTVMVGWCFLCRHPSTSPHYTEEPTLGTDDGEDVESPNNLADMDPAGFRDIRLLEAELHSVKAAYKQMKAEFEEVK